MSDILQIKRGLKEHLPTEALEGELMLCTDTKELYVGINGGIENVAVKLDIVIDSSIPMPVDIGGLKKGTTFDKVPIQDVLMQMLYPYVAPNIVLTVNQNSLNETGVSLDDVTCTIKITKTMHEINSVTILRNGKALQVWDHINASDFVTPVTLIYSQSLSLNEDAIYTVKVEDTKQENEVTTNIHFELPTFVGTCVNKPSNSLEIDAATKYIRRKAPFSYTFTTNNKRMMAVYPESWGELASIKDFNNFELIDSFEHSLITHATRAGSNRYHAYISNLTTLIDYKVNFIF